MAKLTRAELKSAVANYVVANKIAQSFSASYNLSGLLDKIGKLYTVDQRQIDKLEKFDAEFLEYGRTVEEYQNDLILPKSTASCDDVDVVKSNYPTNRPVTYSYDLGDEVYHNTVKKKDLAKGVNNESQLIELIMAEQRRMTNSAIAYRYAVKRQMIGVLADKAIGAMADTGATLWAANTSQTEIGKRFKNSSTGTKWAVLVKPYDSTANKNYADAVANGYLVEYSLVESIAPPTNTATGEAFLKKVMEAEEVAEDLSEGNSLSGNTLGANEGMTLFILQGYKPSLKVDTTAGAFNKEDLAIKSDVIVLPDFGTMTNSGAYAVLVDNRAMRLFPTNEDAGEFINDLKGFVNFFKHFDATAHISLNAFVKVFVAPSQQ